MRGERFDPDDPAVVAATDMMRWELSLYLPSTLAAGWFPRKPAHNNGEANVIGLVP